MKAIDHRRFSISSPPDAATSGRLHERRGLARHWLAPADKADILKQVGALTLAMKLRNWDQTTSRALLETYAVDLADQPLFAIQDACLAFRRKTVGDGWMPTPGDLREEAIKQARWLRKEAIEIDRVLEARQDDDSPSDDREAMKRRFSELSATLRMAPPPCNERRAHANSIEPLDLRTPAERLTETGEKYRSDPIRLSSSALRSIGSPPQDNWSLAA